MYCPVCGAEGTAGLKFCKRCGANLGQTPSKINYGKIAGMFWAIAVFGIVSVGTLIGCMVPLVIAGHAGVNIIGPIMVVGGGVILAIALLLIWQLSRLISVVKDEGEERVRRPVVIRQPDAPQITSPQLAAPPHAVGSVTEHTTRTFDPVYRESEQQR